RRVGHLHLHDQLGVAPRLVDADERRARARVVLVREAAALTRAALHEHAVAVRDELARAVRRERHAVLVVLGLARHADLHGAGLRVGLAAVGLDQDLRDLRAQDARIGLLAALELRADLRAADRVGLLVGMV